MKKKIWIFGVFGVLLLGPAQAKMCAIDAVPAATLLLPYFEVDMGDTSGLTTLFSVNNASSAPAVAHVVLWTNWSAPTIDFDLFLTGYDVQTVNLRDLFDGNLPLTADEQSDPIDAISPHGGDFADHPAWDGSFPNCTTIFDGATNPLIRGTALDRLVNGHTGQPVNSLAGQCLGDDLGGVAVGYVTIDNVNECSLVLDPNDSGYFGAGGTGVVSNDNQLWGDYFIVHPGGNYAQGGSLVHIEADAFFDATSTPSNYTFYGRYTQALGGIDNREPLGTVWGMSYMNGGDVNTGTYIIAWRDSTANNILPAGEDCGIGPDWFPLNETQVVAFNESEDAVELCFFTGGRISPPEENDPACFPYETGKYRVGLDPLDPPFEFGWLFLNLNVPSDSPTGDVDFPAAVGGNIAQSYVIRLLSADGLYSVGLPAVQMSSACSSADPLIVGNVPFF